MISSFLPLIIFFIKKKAFLSIFLFIKCFANIFSLNDGTIMWHSITEEALVRSVS